MGIEGAFEVHRPRRLEGNLKLDRLRREVERVVTPGAGRSELEKLLRVEPQRIGGVLRYLVTSGMAVELVTGYQREHHDLDLVIMDPENENYYWEVYGTDNVTPGFYWAQMKFDPEFLEENARSVMTRGSSGLEAEVVHPAVLLVQKSSDAWGRPPRSKDSADVVAIVRHWKEREGYTREWKPIIRTSLEALPPGQINRTLSRIRTIVQ